MYPMTDTTNLVLRQCYSSILSLKAFLQQIVELDALIHDGDPGQYVDLLDSVLVAFEGTIRPTLKFIPLPHGTPMEKVCHKGSSFETRLTASQTLAQVQSILGAPRNRYDWERMNILTLGRYGVRKFCPFSPGHLYTRGLLVISDTRARHPVPVHEHYAKRFWFCIVAAFTPKVIRYY